LTSHAACLGRSRVAHAAANCGDSQVKSRLKATAVNLGPANTFGAGLVDPNAAGKTC
jgi:hypothetical protein